MSDVRKRRLNEFQKALEANARMKSLNNQLSAIIAVGVLLILGGAFIIVERGAIGGLAVSFLGLCLFACYPSTRKKYDQAKKEVIGSSED
jgi:hypothetical protein